MRLNTFAIAFTLFARLASAAAEAAPEFPVLAWDNVPNDVAVLKKMHDCGFTVAGFVPPAELDACHAAGLKAIVQDARASGYDWTKADPKIVHDHVADLVKELHGHPAVFGYYLIDEPTAALFPGLAVARSAIQELHPGVWPYINLLPNYANTDQLGTATYDEYLEKFITTCHPTILSYDHYALLERGGLRGEYFANLESVRRATVKHDLPFWQIVLSVGHMSYREPTPADMSFQVYTSLAYGARGIAYFKYFTPAVGNYRGGPIDQFGHENPMWHVVQQLNLQIAKLAPTLLQLKSDRVYHFGDMPAGCTGPDENSLVESVTGPTLVGDFTHADGSRYILVVNKSLTSSQMCYPKLRKPGTRMDIVSAYTGVATTYGGEQAFLRRGKGRC